MPVQASLPTLSPSTRWRWWRRVRAVLLCGVALVVLATCALMLLAAPPSPDSSAFRGLIIAHRGGSFGAPENTLGAIRRAKDFGATAVEVDVLLSADGVPVVIHDSTVDRTTNGSGAVSELTVQELQELDASMGMPGYEGERVPTLDEVFRLTDELDLILEIEVKREAEDLDALAAAVAALFPKHDAYQRAWVASFDPRLVYKVRSYDPKIITAFAFLENATGNPIADALLVSDFMPWFLGAGVLDPHAHLASVDRIYAWHDAGYAVNVWTINGCVDKTWFASLGISYTTNCPGEDCADDPSDHMNWRSRRDSGGGPCPVPVR